MLKWNFLYVNKMYIFFFKEEKLDVRLFFEELIIIFDIDDFYLLGILFLMIIIVRKVI